MTSFTAVFGGYDKPPPAPYGGVLFTDRDTPGWSVRLVDPPYPDNLARSNRYYKLQPHKFFEDRVLYHDGNITLTRSPEDTLRACQEHAGGDHDLFTVAHSRGVIAREEPRRVLEWRLAPANELGRQVQRYDALGVPRDEPLITASFYIARLNARTTALFDVWWAEVRDYTHRDQISWPYAVWKTSPDVHTVPWRFLQPFITRRKHEQDRRRW